MSGIPNKDCAHACHCYCHKIPFAAGTPKHVMACCDGKCEHCNNYIQSHLMKTHIKECHPEINTLGCTLVQSESNPTVGIMAFPGTFAAGFAEQIKRRFANEPKQNRSS